MQLRETTNGLGGAATATELSSTAMNNLFDDVTSAEASTGSVEYRALDVYNDQGAGVVSVDIYMSAETSSSDTVIDLGIEASPVGSTTALADEGTAPSGVTFVHADSGSHLSLPDISSAAYVRVFVRRTVSSSATNTSADTGTLEVTYA